MTVATEVLQAYASVFAEALSNLQRIAVGDLIMLLTLGAIVGILLKSIGGNETTHHRRLWLVSYLASLQPGAKKNLVFALVLAVAGYLSIASLAAIPALQETTASPTEVSKEHLQTMLEKNRAETEALLASPGPAADPFESLKSGCTIPAPPRTPTPRPFPPRDHQRLA